jgi:REP element-mobilizing transposase RayT
MSVRRQIPEYDGIYFITITCSEWLHLFELSNGYEEVYKWFDHLKGKGHFIVGYVIMPNHIHALIAFRNSLSPQSYSFRELCANEFFPRRVTRFENSA